MIKWRLTGGAPSFDYPSLSDKRTIAALYHSVAHLPQLKLRHDRSAAERAAVASEAAFPWARRQAERAAEWMEFKYASTPERRGCGCREHMIWAGKPTAAEIPPCSSRNPELLGGLGCLAALSLFQSHDELSHHCQTGLRTLTDNPFELFLADA